MNTIAELRALDIKRRFDGESLYVSGYHVANDGGGGIFRYDASSVLPDDGGMVIRPNAGAGRYIAVLDGPASPRRFGALSESMADLREIKTGNFASLGMNISVAISGYYSSGDGGGGVFDFSASWAGTHNGGTEIAPLDGTGGWIKRKTGVSVSVIEFGAVGDGATIVSSQIQAAINAGYPDIYLPSGIYVTDRTLYLKSSQTIRGEGVGSVIKGAPVWAVPGPSIAEAGGAGNRYMLLSNENIAATEITDHELTVRCLSFSYDGFGSAPGGGTHAIRFRMAEKVMVSECFFYKGNNGTAFLACKNTLVHGCRATHVTNCGFDHWEGCVSAKVSDCDVVAAPTGCNQGIMFTGAGTLLEHRQAYDCSITGCRIYGCNQPSQSAILINALSTGSSSRFFTVANNIIRDCRIGIAVTGNAGVGSIIGNTIVDVGTGCSVFVIPEYGHSPDSVVVSGNVIYGAYTNVGNVAPISCVGTNHVVVNNIIQGDIPFGVRLGGDSQVSFGNIINGATSGRYNLSGATNTHLIETILGGGLVLPRRSSDPAGTVSGEVYYNTTLAKLRTWNGSAWVSLN